MTENGKKQLLIIGNGFDLACGLKSSYADFFKERYKKILTDAEGLIFKKKEYPMRNDRVMKTELIFHDLNQLSCLKENEKIFNSLDLFFVAEHFFQGTNVNRWCDVEELIKEIVSIVNNDVSNEVPKYILNKFNKYIECQNDYLRLTDNKLFDNLKKIEKYFKDYICDISNNYDYVSNEISLLTELTKNFVQSKVLSFNYTYGPTTYSKLSETELTNKIKSYRNIHGSIDKKDNIIFGIDSLNISPSSEMYRFTKTYRIMANNLNDNYIDILNDDVDTITFYGHSLAEADFSYFESIFDYYDIYDSKVTLEFYCVLYRNGFKSINNNLRRKNYEAICKLLYKYGESIGGMRGKNLVHKLLLENRLKIRYKYTR